MKYKQRSILGELFLSTKLFCASCVTFVSVKWHIQQRMNNTLEYITSKYLSHYYIVHTVLTTMVFKTDIHDKPLLLHTLFAP